MAQIFLTVCNLTLHGSFKFTKVETNFPGRRGHLMKIILSSTLLKMSWPKHLPYICYISWPEKSSWGVFEDAFPCHHSHLELRVSSSRSVIWWLKKLILMSRKQRLRNIWASIEYFTSAHIRQNGRDHLQLFHHRWHMAQRHSACSRQYTLGRNAVNGII